MGEHNRPVHCPWCRSTHGRRFLCDAADEMLQASARRGQSGTLPSLELEEPLLMTGDWAADQLMGQFVVKAGLFPGPGAIMHPAIVVTGQDVHGRVLPQWIYASADTDLRAAAALVDEMAELAIRRADAQNRSR